MCLIHRLADDAQQRAQLCARLGASKGKYGQVLTLGDLDDETLGVATQPFQIDLATRGIEHAAIKIIVHPESDQVVNDAALIIEHAAVDGLALFGGAVNVVGQHALEKLARDRKSTRLNSSHVAISYAVFCLKKK